MYIYLINNIKNKILNIFGTKKNSYEVIEAVLRSAIPVDKYRKLLVVTNGSSG